MNHLMNGFSDELVKTAKIGVIRSLAGIGFRAADAVAKRSGLARKAVGQVDKAVMTRARKLEATKAIAANKKKRGGLSGKEFRAQQGRFRRASRDKEHQAAMDRIFPKDKNK